jgi:hypothetical protein
LVFLLYEGSNIHSATNSSLVFTFPSWTSLFIEPHRQKSKRVMPVDFKLQTAISSHPLKIGHMFIWTYLLWIVHTTTSWNIYYSFWNTLYIDVQCLSKLGLNSLQKYVKFYDNLFIVTCYLMVYIIAI